MLSLPYADEAAIFAGNAGRLLGVAAWGRWPARAGPYERQP